MHAYCTEQCETTDGIFMEAYTLWDRLHGRVVKGVGHCGHDEAMEVGGREFDPRPE